MILHFYKYHGAGNDFILINGYNEKIILNNSQVAFLCDRKLGIGADGLIILEKSSEYDFAMRFFNSDGYEGSMCGNGGRCIAQFAHDQKLAGDRMIFIATDGEHTAEVYDGSVIISMNEIKNITEYDDGYFLDSGSPHFVKFVDDIYKVDVNLTGKQLADDKRFSPGRTNVNFVDNINYSFRIATFERGVEAETLACGTGAVATAVVLNYSDRYSNIPVDLKAKGGDLKIFFNRKGNTYSDVKLQGPAQFVYKGTIELP